MAILIGPASLLVSVAASQRPAGTVVSWGEQTLPLVPSGTRFSAITAGLWHSLALKPDGTLVGWGDNQYGQANLASGLSNVIAVAAGQSFNLALKQDGTVVAWGFTYGGACPAA